MEGAVETPPAGLMAGILIFSLAIAVISIASMWKIFAKAGQPGWASLVPIYNAYVLLKVCGKPGWWLALMLIPFVNFVVCVILPFSLAKAFGKNEVWGIGLLLLGIVFMPMLAFGDSRYVGAGGGSGSPAPAPAV
jgi:uncharacterized membrane protein YhaH (DUF805 family)